MQREIIEQIYEDLVGILRADDERETEMHSYGRITELRMDIESVMQKIRNTL